ncbi:ParM/StbA family protein [Acetonema longum]|uniref:Uncharacterized protein n=1 Tax=Acetonema longum DSM 6540 TaxID=1009370 RepID=F7NKE0_9FIRM|nr:ParM/StbA family protein [Acetonema longum]EGO63581.1 hypothetical protein ALO_12766 [Acetonema longum DSM 6540]
MNLTLGNDIGFGNSKRYSLGSIPAIMRSYVGAFREQSVAAGANDSPITVLPPDEHTNMSIKQINRMAIEYEGKRYVLGQGAVDVSDAQNTTDKNRTIEEEGIVLFAAMLAQFAGEGEHTAKIVAGLPGFHYRSKGMREKYHEGICKTHKVKILHPTGAEIFESVIDVTKSMILPQHYATGYHIATQHKTDLQGKRFGILDWGQYTVGLTWIDPGISYNETKSTSISDWGMIHPFREIRNRLAQELNIDVQIEHVDPIAKSRKAMSYGKMIDVGHIIDEVYQEMVPVILSKIKSEWTDMWRLEAIYHTGGGADPLSPFLMPQFPDEQAHIAPNAPIANALGMGELAAGDW